jgi:hypothetical protein
MDGSSSPSCVGNMAHIGQRYNAAYDKMMGNTTQCAKIANLLGNGILLAVFVIGCLGAGGVFSGAVMGWIVVGLGAGYMAMKLLGGNVRNRRIDLISSTVVAASILTFGALGVTGVLATAHIGYALIGSVAMTALAAICMRIVAKRKGMDNKGFIRA